MGGQAIQCTSPMLNIVTATLDTWTNLAIATRTLV